MGKLVEKYLYPQHLEIERFVTKEKIADGAKMEKSLKVDGR